VQPLAEVEDLEQGLQPRPRRFSGRIARLGCLPVLLRQAIQGEPAKAVHVELDRAAQLGLAGLAVLPELVADVAVQHLVEHPVAAGRISINDRAQVEVDHQVAFRKRLVLVQVIEQSARQPAVGAGHGEEIPQLALVHCHEEAGTGSGLLVSGERRKEVCQHGRVGMLLGIHGAVVEGAVLTAVKREIAADAIDALQRGAGLLGPLFDGLDEGGLAVAGVAREDGEAHLTGQQRRNQLAIQPGAGVGRLGQRRFEAAGQSVTGFGLAVELEKCVEMLVVSHCCDPCPWALTPRPDGRACDGRRFGCSAANA